MESSNTSDCNFFTLNVWSWRLAWWRLKWDMQSANISAIINKEHIANFCSVLFDESRRITSQESITDASKNPNQSSGFSKRSQARVSLVQRDCSNQTRERAAAFINQEGKKKHPKQIPLKPEAKWHCSYSQEFYWTVWSQLQVLVGVSRRYMYKSINFAKWSSGMI